MRRHASHGFSFIEVLIALAILLVGSVSILSLFAIGVHHQVERRIEKRLQQVRPEILAIAQDIVDQSDPLKLPNEKADGTTDIALSQPGYAVDLRFSANPFHGQGVLAHAVIKFRGEPVRVLRPIPVFRSTLTPKKSN
jgi:prepilin-type N-terminal cleavage/methylation domain-containing protein